METGTEPDNMIKHGHGFEDSVENDQLESLGILRFLIFNDVIRRQIRAVYIPVILLCSNNMERYCMHGRLYITMQFGAGELHLRRIDKERPPSQMP